MLIKLMKADFYKQKRSPLMLVLMLVPIAIGVLLFMDFYIRMDYLAERAAIKSITMWEMLVFEQNMTYFKQFIPVLGSIILVSLFDEEYRNNGWNLVMTYPVKKWAVAISKLITASVYMCILLIVNIVVLIGLGIIFKFTEPINWMFFFKMLVFQFIGAMGTMSIHLLIVLWNKKTYITVGIAFVASIFSGQLFFNGSNIAKYIPYNFPLIADGLVVDNINNMVILAAVIFIIGTIATLVYFNNKESY